MKLDRDNFWNRISKAGRIGIAGHIKPDGDCVGSCMALYDYITDNYSAKVEVSLETVPEVFRFLPGSDVIKNTYDEREPYDIFIALDSGDIGRLGEASGYFNSAVYRYAIDHHITNLGYADENLIIPEAAATCEILFDLFDKNKITSRTAEALYLGLIHDTGVFKHTNTSRHTMEVAGILIEKGVIPSRIIDGTFYEKTYVQNQILGRCLMESIMVMNGKVIISSVSLKIMQLYQINSSDLEGIIDQLRVTKGIETAILLRQSDIQEWKVSMRSNSIVDVGKICVKFGGGGHVHAAGCTIKGGLHDVINNLTRCIEVQMINCEDK